MRILLIGNYDRAFLMCRTALMSALVAAGHELLVLAPAETPGVPQALEALGVGFRPIALDRTGIDPVSDLRSFFGLWSAFRELRPDIVVSYTAKPVIYGSLAARLSGVPGIFSMITGLGYLFMGDTLRQRLVRALVTPLYRLALAANRALFFLNPDDRALFLERGIIKETCRTVLLNGEGIDTDHYRCPPQGETAARPSFLMIARLLRDKGVYEFVEAAAFLKRRHPEASFRLLGPLDGNPTAIGQADLEEWRREGSVEYLGETRDVRPYLADAGVFVLPSYREGLPLTVMEAMSMGRPVVTTDAPGCRQTVVEGENGFLVPVRDAQALARAMERFILDPELMPRMGRRSREIVEERYDVRKVSAAILQALGVAS
jgi:glycosyltransferase involved in cell wall biosynthesis